MQQKQSEFWNTVSEKLYIKTVFPDEALVYSNNPNFLNTKILPYTAG
jgi:hypothetical protein